MASSRRRGQPKRLQCLGGATASGQDCSATSWTCGASFSTSVVSSQPGWRRYCPARAGPRFQNAAPRRSPAATAPGLAPHPPSSPRLRCVAQGRQHLLPPRPLLAQEDQVREATARDILDGHAVPAATLHRHPVLLPPLYEANLIFGVLPGLEAEGAPAEPQPLARLPGAHL